jgi:hypothetical protein
MFVRRGHGIGPLLTINLYLVRMNTKASGVQEVINNSSGKLLTKGKFMQFTILMKCYEMLCELFIRI